MLARFFRRRVSADRALFRSRRTSPRRRRLGLESLERRAMLDAAAASTVETYAAGSWGWAASLGDNSSVEDIAVDSEGNVVVTGFFSGSPDVDPSEGETTLSSAGEKDAFVAKYEPDGALIWVRSLSGTGTIQGDTIAIDRRDNSIVVGGHFEGSASINDGLAINTLTSVGYYDAFMLKLDADGRFRWSGTVGSNRGPTFGNGDGLELVSAIEIDESGDIVSAGMFNGEATVSFGTTTAALSSGGPQNTFILRTSESGELSWAKQFTSGFLNTSFDVAIGPSGDIAIAGMQHSQSVDFDPGPNTAYSSRSGLADGYLAVLSSDGSYRWAYALGTGNEDYNFGVTFDSVGNVYSVGYFGGGGNGQGGRIDLDPGQGSAEFISTTSYDEVHTTKLTQNGEFVWGTVISGTNHLQPGPLAIAPSGELMISGWYKGTVDFDPGNGIQSRTSRGQRDGFLLSLNPTAGTYEHVITFGGASSDAQEHWKANFAFGPNGRGYYAAATEGTLNFTPNQSGPAVGSTTTSSGYIWQFATPDAPSRHTTPFIGNVRAFDGDTVAFADPAGNGTVYVADFLLGGGLSIDHTIASPDSVHGSSPFGTAMTLQGTLVGIGSPLTWKSNPHDGRFYAYDTASKQIVQNVNPSPHTAQYFGVQAAAGDGFVVVAEQGNTDYDPRAAITLYSTSDDAAPLTLAERKLFPSQVGGDGAVHAVTASGDLFAVSYRLSDTQVGVLEAWQVVRDANGQVTGSVSLGRIEEESLNLDTSLNNSLFEVSGGFDQPRGFAMNDRFIAVGQSLRAVDGVASGRVNIAAITSSGLEFYRTITPPTPQDGMAFGDTVALNGADLFVAAPNAASSAAASGDVYHYKLESPSPESTYSVLSQSLADYLEPTDTFAGEMRLADGKLIISTAVDSAIVLPLASALTISHNVVREDAGAGIIVGRLSSLTSSDEKFTFELAPDTAAIDNDLFSLEGSILRTAANIPAGTRASHYSIDVIGRSANGSVIRQTLRLLPSSVASNFILGTDGPDTLTGTVNSDYLIGFAGDDNIVGGESDDVIDAGDGNDNISGDAGDDIIDAGPGDDTIDGGEGDDVIFTGTGNDTVDGGSGSNTFHISSTAGQIIGGVDNDRFYFLSGGDEWNGVSINTGDGDNTVEITTHFGTIVAGDGNDSIRIDGGFKQWATNITLGGGDDYLYARADINNGPVYAGDGNDLIEIYGGQGDGAFNSRDFLLGSGNDRITIAHNAGTGRARVYGEGGDDTIDMSAATEGISGWYAYGGDGNDTILAPAGSTTPHPDDGLRFPVVNGEAGNDVLNGTILRQILIGGSDASCVWP